MAKQSINVLTLGKTPLTTILKLAWPTIIEQMMFTVLNFSDTAMVGALGAVATAAVGITSTSIWLSGSVISAVSVGLSIQLAQSVGAGNYKRAREVVGQSLLTSLVVGAALTLVFFSLHWNLPAWLGAEEAVVPHAQAYLQVIALSLSSAKDEFPGVCYKEKGTTVWPRRPKKAQFPKQHLQRRDQHQTWGR